MALKIGIVGLPNVGKSTLFNALTRTRAAQAANYPFCTINPNVGVVEVPDERLQKLTELVKPEKVIPAAIEFVDIAGLVKGASKGEGLGNAFLSHIREVDAICHVVRAFQGGDIIHVEGTVDPERDRGTIETELALADLQSLTKRIEKTEGAARSGDKQKILELAVAKRISAALEQEQLASTVSLSAEELPMARSFQLLTLKTLMYAVNVAEEEMATITSEKARAMLKLDPSVQVIVISAKIEETSRRFLWRMLKCSSRISRSIPPVSTVSSVQPTTHSGYITYFTARSEGSARVDDHLRHDSPSGGRRDSHGFRARIHPRGDHLV